MSYQYNINDLSEKCQVSKQSIYSQISRNKAFVSQNSKRIQRRIYYNQSVLDWLLEYYQIKEYAETRENAPKNVSDKEPDQISIETLKAQINALEAKIEALEKELASKEEERKEILNQNGALLLLLSQEKQEKALLLHAPKKSIGERIKGIFHKS